MTALARFDRRGRWGETLVCDLRVREQLQSLGVEYGRWPAPAGLPAHDVHLHYVVDGTALFYVGLEGGWAGVLCEAGEWLMTPGRLRLGLDRGAQDASGVLHVQGAAGSEPARLPASLPAHDDFVQHLLELLGEEEA